MINRGWFDERLTEPLLAYEASTRDDVEFSEAGRIDTTSLPDETQVRLSRAIRCVELLRAIGPSLTASRTSAKQSHHEPVAPLHAAKRSIGRFSIIEELGSGGFGIVYRAWDPVTTREIALKVPRIEALASEDLRRRFEQEARAAARLDHTHIATILDAGIDGLLPYIASVYYPGITLAKWLRESQTAVSPRDAAQLIHSLALAIEHAHQRGVLHRDIKPSNVLLVPRTEGASIAAVSSTIPKLMDFGLAKVTNEVADLTHTGAMLGTLRYMPPEQAMGRTKSIGPASDVYGLGMVLYELLAGVAPFAAANEFELLRRIPTELPSRIRKSRPEVPVDLETIVLKCLEKEPLRRYSTAQELADDLARYLGNLPIQARQSTRPERLWKWTRRNPVWAALWSVSAAAVLAIVTGLLLSNHSIRRERDRALASEMRTNQHLYASDMQQAQQAILTRNFLQAENLLTEHVPKAGEHDYRDFAWSFLHRVLHLYDAKLPKHPADVYGVAFSSDGKRLVTVCRDGHTRVWGWPQLKLIKVLVDHVGEVNEVAFSADGRWLATGGDDGRIFLRDAISYEIKHVLAHLDQGQPAEIASLVFAPDSSRLYTAAATEIYVWDVDSGNCEVQKSAGSSVNGLCISPDGKWLRSTSQDISFVWDAVQLKPRVLHEPFSTGTSACFLPDSQRLLSSEGEGALVIRSANDGGELARLKSATHRAKTRALAFSPNGRLAVSGSDDQTIDVFEAESCCAWRPFAGILDASGKLRFRPMESTSCQREQMGRCLFGPRQPAKSSNELTALSCARNR